MRTRPLKAVVVHQTKVEELTRRAIRNKNLRVGIGIGAVLFDAVLAELVRELLVFKAPLLVPRFGTFSIVTRAARNGVHPKTKEPMRIDKSWRVYFRAAKNLRGKGEP